MQSFYDYKKYAILYVDDEEKSLKYFLRAFGDQFRILTAPSAQEGVRLLEAHPDQIGILMTDQRMPGEKGVQFLERSRQLQPRIIRILCTAYADMEAAIQAVNTGAIYKYVTKPWDIPQLETTLKRGLEFFIVQRERDALLREKLTALHNLMITDRVISLGVLAAGLGHYVRNALVAVRTFLDLAPAKLQEERVDVQSLRNPQFWRDFYLQVQHQVKRITSMLNDLGDLAPDPHAPYPDQVQLDQVIQAAIQHVDAQRAEKKIVICSQVPTSLPPLCVERAKFDRLFELLLEDECLMLPAGSRIDLRAELLPAASGQPPEILLEVQDNGPGLPKDALRAIFDPFFIRSDDPQLYGVNLMACYFIIHHHNGRIQVENCDPGSLFRIHLPTQPSARSPEACEREVLDKVLLNDRLWDRLLAGE
ncbi:MAG TPA: response regulator [Candidatus Paceibacterota bacterium]|nr:response regulator [Verrucomicrobiota bacterium]HOX03311.1 response regulator [Verrucomicrobiota bacterium]HRZ46231.1 response regulator [Candidatus Paceibacterota bacterium]